MQILSKLGAGGVHVYLGYIRLRLLSTLRTYPLVVPFVNRLFNFLLSRLPWPACSTHYPRALRKTYRQSSSCRQQWADAQTALHTEARPQVPDCLHTHNGWGTRQHLGMDLEGGTPEASYHNIKAWGDERASLYLHHKYILHTLIFQESFILAGGKTMAEAPI